jgi:lipopolysaccharide export system permease protein
MRKIESYIFRKILYPFFFCLILITTIYMVVDISTKLEDFIKHKTALELILQYYLLSLPQIIFQVTPLCLLVSAIYSLTKMNRYNEIIAMRASGISLLTLLKPYFAFALVITSLMFANQEKLIPLTENQRIKLEKRFEGKKQERVYRNVTFYAQGNRIIFAQEFYPREKILNYVVILEQNLNKKVIYKITAESAQYINNRWVLYNLIIYKLNPRTSEIEEAVALNKKEYDLNEDPVELMSFEMELTYQPLKKLFLKISHFRGISQEVVRRLLVEFYHKISFPLTNIILLLLALYVGFKSRQASLLKGLGISLIIGFSYYTFDAFAYSLGKTGILPPWTAGFLANIFFLVIGGYLLFKKTF